MTLLEVSDIHTRYGAIEALKGVSLTVDAGEVVTLIGSNGPASPPPCALSRDSPRPAQGRSRSPERTSRACRRTR